MLSHVIPSLSTRSTGESQINFYLLVSLVHLSYFLLYFQNYKEFEAEILDLQTEKYGLSFDIKNVLLPVENWGMRM